eukprot:scaffold3717_cov124-Isochrysis_galbana.AAC.14
MIEEVHGWVLWRVTLRGGYTPVFQCVCRARSEARLQQVLLQLARKGRCEVAQSDACRGWGWSVPQA